MNSQKLSRRLLIGTLSGVFLEYFDYTLYGFSAPFIAHLFFPFKNPGTALLLTWAVFAISFLVRPLGAVIFGHIADRVGRKHVLVFTILLMCLSTIAIGFLPTYQTVGIFAPVFLLLCRILQGISVSTEYSGCSTYLLEFKKTHKGLLSGIITSASGFGVFAASLLVLLFHTINWRYPFIIAGVVVGALGFYLRLGLQETPEFLLSKIENKLVKFPFIEMLKKMPRLLLKMVIVSAFAGVLIIVIEIYLPTYLQNHFHIARHTTLQLSTYLALIEACFAILCGFCSDYIGQTKMMVLSAMLTMIAIFPLMQLFHSSHIYIWYLAATLLALIVAMVDGPIAAYLVDHFPTSVRYSGVSFSYNLGAALIGGFSPSLLILLQNHITQFNIFNWYFVIASCLLLVAMKVRTQ